nr:MAG TPA: Flagellar basal-body rod protein FlgG bacterial flagellar motor, MOTOR.4A [Caudoviricetes sp.]
MVQNMLNLFYPQVNPIDAQNSDLAQLSANLANVN